MAIRKTASGQVTEVEGQGTEIIKEAGHEPAWSPEDEEALEAEDRWARRSLGDEPESDRD
jgi:hypothetical protein